GGVVQNGPLVFWTLTEASRLMFIDHAGKRVSVDGVVQARVGLDAPPPRDWIGRPDRDGLISLAELPPSADVLLAAGDLPQRTLFRLRKFPIPGDIATQQLNPPYTSPDTNISQVSTVGVEVKVARETDTDHEIMVVKLHNLSRQEWRLSARDLVLETEI